ncbi:MAG: hypothetical protein ACRD40_01730 [Candidatus Acidiferrales bacterium]
MKVGIILLAMVCLIGCSSSGSGGNGNSGNGGNSGAGSQTVSLSAGQWELAFGTGTSAFYLEANLSSGSNNAYFSSAANTQLVSASEFYAPVQGGGLGYGECSNWTLNLMVSGNTLSNQSVLTSPGSTPPTNTYSLSGGTIAADGKSISN